MMITSMMPQQRVSNHGRKVTGTLHYCAWIFLLLVPVAPWFVQANNSHHYGGYQATQKWPANGYPRYADPLRATLEDASSCRADRPGRSGRYRNAGISSSFWGAEETDNKNGYDDNRILQSGPAPEDLKDHYTFAVVPKQFIEFFEPTKLGCKDHAARLSSKLDATTVECLYTGPVEAADRGVVQAQIVIELLWGGTDVEPTPIDGLAISVVDESLMTPILLRAKDELGIPVVTFDSDAPDSGRSYYIGTNNSFFGRQLGRQMEALNPGGGTYAIISGESTNLQARANGIIQELIEQTASNPDSTWTQLEDSPFDAKNNQTLALEKLDSWAAQNPTVLLSVTGLPMRIKTLDDGEVYAPWQDFVDKNVDRDITLLCADASPHQLKFLEYDYIDGLAGQLPYDMGIKSIDALWTLLGDPNADLGDNPGSDVIGTNVLWHLQIPLKLPKVEVETNRVGGLKFIGYTLFSIIALTAVVCIGWVYKYQHVRVVRVAQPRFLFMIAIGVIVMTSCMIPAGLDDFDSGGLCHEDGEETSNVGHCRAICMSVPWLASIGFTTTFSAMYAKTRRVTKIFRTQSAFTRIQVSEKDVMIPFFILLTINLTILVCWQIIDPMVYHREAYLARDEWNRVISTYGSCKSDNMVYFLVPLILVNTGVLILANWQTYQARHIQSEFAETKSITICMASLLQAMISGVPVLFFVNDNPQAYYMVFTLLCFIVGMVILLVIFVPKVVFAYQFLQMTQSTQGRHMASVIAKTAKAASSKDFSQRSGLSMQDDSRYGPGKWTSSGWISSNSMDGSGDNIADLNNNNDPNAKRRISIRRDYQSPLVTISSNREQEEDQTGSGMLSMKDLDVSMSDSTSDEDGEGETPLRASAKAAAMAYVKAMDQDASDDDKARKVAKPFRMSVETAATEEMVDETENPQESQDGDEGQDVMEGPPMQVASEERGKEEKKEDDRVIQDSANEAVHEPSDVPGQESEAEGESDDGVEPAHEPDYTRGSGPAAEGLDLETGDSPV